MTVPVSVIPLLLSNHLHNITLIQLQRQLILAEQINLLFIRL
jgi:hypothetical protein